MKLSKREKEVLNLASLGGTSKSIGKELSISPKTVEVHIYSLRKKLGAKNIQHAVRLGIEIGQVELEPCARVKIRKMDAEACSNDPKIVSVVVPLSENFNEGISLLEIDLSPVPYSITDINKDK